MIIFKTGDLLRVFFYDFDKKPRKDDKPESICYGIIVNDNPNKGGYIEGKYLHNGSTFNIVNGEDPTDTYGRIVLEKL